MSDGNREPKKILQESTIPQQQNSDETQESFEVSIKDDWSGIKTDLILKNFLRDLGDQLKAIEGYQQKKYFISYAWEKGESKELQQLHSFIKKLCTDLEFLGLRVIWDKEHNRNHMKTWTEQSIEESSYIIIIGTPLYKKKAVDSSTNVSFEFTHIFKRLKGDNSPELFPILFSGNHEDSFPKEVLEYRFMDFRDLSKYQEKLFGYTLGRGWHELGLIPAIFASFRDDPMKYIYRQAVENYFRSTDVTNQDGCPTPIRPPKSFDRNEILKRKQEDYEPGTRAWIFDALINNTKERRAAFLLSPAGMGKSCIMAELTVRCCPSFKKKKKDDRLNILAYHFFDWTDENAKSGEFALKSIASQLCEFVPGFSQSLSNSDEELKGELEKKEGKITELFKLLIVQPCKKLPENSKPFTILFDALDECEQAQEFSAAIKKLWGEVPTFVSLLVSSRPATFVQHDFKRYNPLLLDPMDKQNREDLKFFLEKRLRSWGVTDQVLLNLLTEALLSRSQGLFLWLAFQLKDLMKLAKENKLTVDAIQSLPDGIQETYAKHFQRLYDLILSHFRKNEEKTQEMYQLAVTFGLILPRTAIPEDIWKECLGFTDEELEDKTLYKKFKDNASQLLFFDSKGTIRAPHKSMSDWLLNIGYQSAEKMELFHLAVDPTKIPINHHRLAQVLEDTFKRIEIPSYETNEDLNRKEKFACSHALYHWSESNDLQNASIWLLDFKHLYRLVCQAHLDGDYSRLIIDSDKLHSKLSASPGLKKEQEKARKILRALRLAEKALMNNPRELANQILGNIDRDDVDFQEILKDCNEWIQLAVLELLPEVLQNTESSAPWQRSKLMMVGRGRAGKSSTVRSFMGLPFDENLESTIGADTKKVVTVYRQDVNTKIGKGKDPWKQKHPAEEFPSMVARATINKRSENQEDFEFSSSDDETEDKDSHSEPTFISTTEARASQKVTPDSQSVESPESYESVPTTTQLSSKSVPETESVKQYEYELSSDDMKVKVSNAVKNEQEGGKDRVTLSIWDYGGQKVFHALHHIFLTNLGIYCVVFNMADLVGPSCTRKSERKALDLLKFWLRSIKLHAKKAPIFLVGTRKDEIESLSSHKEISNLLNKRLKLHDDYGQICPYKLDDDYLYFFPIDNKKGSDHDSVIAQLKEEIITKVMNEKYVKNKVPITWIKTFDRFRNKERDKNPYLKIEEAVRIATEAGVREDRITKMLKFFHQLGVFCYFDSNPGLKDILILDPQWIVDNLTKIICDFDIHKHERLQDWKVRNKFEDDIKLLRSKGVLSTKFLKYLWADIGEREQTFLLKLMEKMSLLSPWDTNGDPKYLVPSMLRSKRSKEEKDEIDLKNNKRELVFDFNFQKFFLPRGLFPCLVAKVVSQSTPDFEPVLYKKKALLSFEERVFTLENVSDQDIIQVGVEQKMDAFSVRKFLVKILEKLREEIMSDRLIWSIYFHLEISSKKLTVSLDEIEKAITQRRENVFSEKEKGRFPEPVLLSSISWLLEEHKNGWFIKEDPNLKLFLLELKDEIEKSRNQAEKKKVVFISYAWEKSGSEELENLQNFIKQLCSDLQLIGLTVYWDKLHIFGDMNKWMQNGIAESSHIIVIGTPLYRNKAYDPSTNVYKEFNHILARLEEKHRPDLLPVLFSGNNAESFPDKIQRFIFLDFSVPSKYLSSLLQPDSSGLIPGVFKEFKNGGNLNRMYELLKHKTFPQLTNH